MMSRGGIGLRWPLVATALVLVAIGQSAIGIAADRNPRLRGIGGLTPAQRQAVWIGGAMAVAAITTAIRPARHRAWALGLAAAALAALVMVLGSRAIHGSRRWIILGPLRFQPSEGAKAALVIGLARALEPAAAAGRLSWRTLAVVAAAALAAMGLISAQPDLGTALIFGPVILAMLSLAGPSRLQWAAVAAAAVLALPLVWSGMTRAQRARLDGFLHQRDLRPPPGTEGYQLFQSKCMIAVGGWAGDDRAVARHLPEAHTDFIFSIIAGRWGLVGSGTVLVLFTLLVGGAAGVALRCADPFGMLLAGGVAALWATEVAVNAAMTVGLLPVVGIPLPLVGYGGSSLMANALALGWVLGLARRPNGDRGFPIGNPR